jgi:predicted glycoside hydrolase/deacetylase ChbG (UPF0249 family)
VVELHRVRTPSLLKLIAQAAATPGLTELGCHPARVTDDLVSSYSHAREVELATLTDPDVRARIEEFALTLVSYHDWPER